MYVLFRGDEILEALFSLYCCTRSYCKGPAEEAVYGYEGLCEKGHGKVVREEGLIGKQPNLHRKCLHLRCITVPGATEDLLRT